MNESFAAAEGFRRTAEVEAERKAGAPLRKRKWPDDPPKPKLNVGPPNTEAALNASKGAEFAEALDAAIEKNNAKPASKPKPEPEPEAQRVMLPAVVPQSKPPAKSEWDQAIDAMNDQHAIIENVGGRTMIASWEPSPTDPKRKEIVFQSKESFLLRYKLIGVAISAALGACKE